MKQGLSPKTKSTSPHNLLAILLTALLALGPGATLANASGNSYGPWPADTPRPGGLIPAILDLIETLPFLLGEVDTSTLGVSDAEMSNSGTEGQDHGHSNNDGDSDSDSDRACNNKPEDSPDMVTVDNPNDGIQCPNAQYQSIQEALLDPRVNDGNPNDRDYIKVCPGVYEEQVRVVGPQYNKLTLFSRTPLAAIVKAPDVMIDERSIFTVKGAKDVEIRHFKITGPASNIFAGVRVMDDIDPVEGIIISPGSALIRHNRITNIRQSTGFMLDVEAGHAVNIGRQMEQQSGTAIVRHNLIDNYQRTGVFLDGGGSFGEIRHNIIAAGAQCDDFPSNGIQVSNFARAKVHHNWVKQNRFGSTSQDFDAVGILTFKVVGSETATETDVIISKNATYFNEVGIGLDRETFQIEVSHNSSWYNDQDGIRAYTGNDGPPPVPPSALGSPQPTDNSPSNQAEQNMIIYNLMVGNDEHDCHDDTSGTGTAGTANFWIKNKGNTQNRTGLCKR
jgi:hypothetical protein